MFNFRKFFFNIQDVLNCKTIYDHIDDISTIYHNPRSSESLSKIKEKQFKLFNYVIENVPFYSVNVNLKNDISLGSFPIINKNIIRDNENSFISNTLSKDKLIKVVTSGSTGTPFAIYQDIKKRKRNTADAIFFGELAGFEIGKKLNYLKIWTKLNRKSKIKFWLENINPIDVTQMSESDLARLTNEFVKCKTAQSFLGYASAFEAICSFLDKNAPATKIKNVNSIIAMSEGLNDYTKKALFNYFGKNPVSRYSNVENGIIAQQLTNGFNSFYINWSSYYIEIMDFDLDKQLPLGEAGRIVVTDYYNYAMPLIRYDTGDIGVLDWDFNKERIVLTKVEGRKMDMVYNTMGNLVSSFTITNNMWRYPEIKQYQFIQLDSFNYLFKLNIEGIFDREQELITEFKNYFGQNAHIIVEYVNEIPLLNSGKRKKVINLTNKS
jgi:phenylacetate-CoA ligase